MKPTWLSPNRLSILAEINKDIAQIFFASVLVDPFINNKWDPYLVTFGIFLSILFWTSSLLLTRE